MMLNSGVVRGLLMDLSPLRRVMCVVGTGVILACLPAFWRYDARTAGAPEDAGREQFA